MSDIPPHAHEDYRWFSDNRGEITEEYPDRFVVVHMCRVVGSGERYEDAVRAARAAVGSDAFLLVAGTWEDVIGP